MADVLAFLTNQTHALILEDEARAMSFRVKVTDDESIARSWLATRDFDVLILDDGIGQESCRELWTLLWERQPNASCFYIHPLASAVDKARLLYEGVLVFDSEEPLAEIKDYLQELADYQQYLREHERFEILLVEDLDSPREIVAIYLESLGFPHVEPVRNAEEALTLLQEKPGRFSCVVTDLNMPGMQGETLLSEIRKDATLKHLPVIILTAHGTMDRVKECLRIGASGFLVKPPRKAEIEKELQRAKRIILGRQSPRLVSHSDMATLDALLSEYNH